MSCETCNKDDLDCECLVKCNLCGLGMPKLRLEVSILCAKCAGVQPYIGATNVTHKTGNDIVIIRGNDKEALRRVARANRRAR